MIKTCVHEHKLVIPKTIQRWDEAIPLGNGICGALIWGQSNHLRFSLDRYEIWDTSRLEGTYAEEYTYETMVRLAREGKNDEIRRIFDLPYNYLVPTKLPAGKLIFDFGSGKNVCSILDIQQAEATLQVADRVLKSFIHATETVGLIQIDQPNMDFHIYIEKPDYGIEGIDEAKVFLQDSIKPADLKNLIYPEVVKYNDGRKQFFVQKISDDLSYGIFLRLKESAGMTEIAYTVSVSTDGEAWQEQAWQRVENALCQGYDKMLQSHRQWWIQYWSKSSISVPNPLFQNNWELTQYFLACCSRKGGYPMTLQGLWTADDGALPPWKGDYHLDLNVQMSYYSYLKANHIEEGEALIDYLWALMETSRKFAKRFYDSQGICLPSVMTITGEPLGGWPMYSLSPTNQLWTSQLMERHYRFTGDKKFLKEKAYPYLEETASFILGLLEKKNGKYYLPISSSPEIHDDTLDAFLTPNSNYDLSLMRYLFDALVKLSVELENGKEAQWMQILQLMPELAVTDQGGYKLSPDEELIESHRHLSHAMAIHPLRQVNYNTEEGRKTIDATIEDLEKLGSKWWVGYSFAWMAELYAVQRNGNGAAKQLELFWDYFCSSNGFHLNGDFKRKGLCKWTYRPFTLEGNFCAADALQEMLLQTEDNVLHFFPAIPEEWMGETVSFTDFCAEKGLLVSAVLEKGEVRSIILKPKYSGRITIRLDEKVSNLITNAAFNASVGNRCVEMYLQEGLEYRLMKEKGV